MESKQRILVTIGLGVFLVFIFLLITGAITKHTGFSVSEVKENSFETCLKEQDIKLYINTQEVSETLKRMVLFDYFQYFQIQNCLKNNKECLENEIDSFPTWVINNNKIKGELSLNKLEEVSGCKSENKT
jgi:hypothetical protein